MLEDLTLMKCVYMHLLVSATWRLTDYRIIGDVVILIVNIIILKFIHLLISTFIFICDKYPTGQNDSLELMFAKFLTAKNREPTKRLFQQSLFAWKQHRRCVKLFSRCSPTDLPISSTALYDWAIQPPVPQPKKILRLFANHLFGEYRARTTPSRMFVPCNLSSCRVMNILRACK